MKQKLLLLLMALAALQPLRLVARDFTYTYEGQIVTYTVIDEDAKTCSTKQGTYSKAGNSVSGDLILPSSPTDGENTYTLISIAQCSFLYNEDLISIVIPETVKEIGNYSFYSCQNLSDVRINGDIPIFGASVFGQCQLMTLSIEDPNYAVKEGILSRC